ncbi:MAG: TonB family protein [Candidatus Eisenbacteria bacterium]
MTARAEVREKHTAFLRTAFVLAGLIHVVIFAFWPEYVPSVYQLPEIVIPEWLEIEPERVIPPIPKETEPPDIPVRIAASDDVDDDETIPHTLVDSKDFIHRPVVAPPQPDSFIPFDTPPELMTSAEPVYPELARRAEVEGMVVVLVTIDESGRVIGAEVATSDSSVFDEAALAAAYKFAFRPALQRDIPVKARIAIRFRFSLTD